MVLVYFCLIAFFPLYVYSFFSFEDKLAAPSCVQADLLDVVCHFEDEDVTDKYLTSLWCRQIGLYFQESIGYDSHQEDKEKKEFYGYVPSSSSSSETNSYLKEGQSSSKLRETICSRPFKVNEMGVEEEGYYIRHIAPKEAAEDKTKPEIDNIYYINAVPGSGMYPKGLFDPNCCFDHKIFEEQPVLWTFGCSHLSGKLLIVRNARPASASGGFLILYHPHPSSQQNWSYPILRIPHLPQTLSDDNSRREVLELILNLSRCIPSRFYICFNSYGGNCSNSHLHFRLESLNSDDYFVQYQGLGHFNWSRDIDTLGVVDSVDQILAFANSEYLPFNMGFYQGNLSLFLCRPDAFNPSFSGYNKGFGSLEKMFNVHALYDRETFAKLFELDKEDPKELVQILLQRIREQLSIRTNRVNRYADKFGLTKQKGVTVRYFTSELEEIREPLLLFEAFEREKKNPTSTTNYFKPPSPETSSLLPLLQSA